MARGSQGIIIRRESSAVGSTGVQTASDIAHVVAGNTITSPTGFANMSTGMRFKSNSPANTGIYTIKTTAATAITCYEAIAAEASGNSVTLTGHAMTNIGEIVSFNGPAMTAAVIDVTTLLSTAKEKLVSVYDAGQFSISVLYDDDTPTVNLHEARMRDMQARTHRQFDITFPATSTAKTGAVYFGGYISAYNISGAVDNAMKAEITIALASGVDFITNTATA